MVSISGMAVSLKTDLRFPVTGQQGHGSRNIHSPKDTTWFLCECDYNDNSKSQYKWNEFELLELNASIDDVEWSKKIKEWWSQYFSIMLSVDGCYSFWAINIVDGTVVRGSEPEFEEVEKVANNFGEFLLLIMENKICIN